MNFKIKQYLPFITQSKDLLAYIIICILLIVMAFAVTGKLFTSFQSAQDTKAKITTMNIFLKEWSNKTTLLNKEAYRPIKNDFVDSVQSVLISNLATNKLELVGFKSITQNDKKSKNKNFELTFKGDYAASINYLNNFHAKDALINIESLKMQQTQGQIVTVIQYRIYIL